MNVRCSNLDTTSRQCFLPSSNHHLNNRSRNSSDLFMTAKVRTTKVVGSRGGTTSDRHQTHGQRCLTNEHSRQHSSSCFRWELLNGATCVYVVNVSGSLANITVTDCYSNGVVIGNVGVIPILANTTLFLRKNTTDQLWAQANSVVLVVPIAREPS
jgi:hypothetical protein